MKKRKQWKSTSKKKIVITDSDKSDHESTE